MSTILKPPEHKKLVEIISVALRDNEQKFSDYMKDMCASPYKELRWIEKYYDVASAIEIQKFILRSVGEINGCGADENGLVKEEIWESIFSHAMANIRSASTQGNAGSRLFDHHTAANWANFITSTRYW